MKVRCPHCFKLDSPQPYGNDPAKFFVTKCDECKQVYFINIRGETDPPSKSHSAKD